GPGGSAGAGSPGACAVGGGRHAGRSGPAGSRPRWAGTRTARRSGSAVAGGRDRAVGRRRRRPWSAGRRGAARRRRGGGGGRTPPPWGPRGRGAGRGGGPPFGGGRRCPRLRGA